MPNQVENHQPNKYVFELIVGGKSAKSGILKVKEEIICLRFIGMHFDTNKNFLLPDAMNGIQSLIDIYKQHPDSELLVVGHTDRSGSPSYNDPLSVERADAVAAFLTDDVDAWLARYKTSVSSEKRWGTIEDNHMLESLADFPTKPATQSAVEWFQETRGLGVDNDAGPETRRQLITEYMAHDKTTLPAGVEMVTHGCGENFPLDEAGEVDANAPDGEKDDKDRRVEIFVFDPPGIRPKPKGKNSKKGSKEYLEWRESTTLTYDYRAKFKHASEIIIVDEIGLPLANTSVTVESSVGNTFTLTTDNLGKIFLTLPPGSSFQIEAANIHEAASGDSTKTGSGQHFATNGTGP